jgi:hypothetical protein
VGRAYFAAGLGARLRQPVELGNVRLGTELALSLGAGASLLPRGYLDLSVEAWALPSLISEASTQPDGSRLDARLVPAEWMLSLRTHLRRFTLALGGGGALPLSGATTTATDGTTSSDTFAGLTTPDFRTAFVVRYETDPSQHP